MIKEKIVDGQYKYILSVENVMDIKYTDKQKQKYININETDPLSFLLDNEITLEKKTIVLNKEKSIIFTGSIK